MSEPVEPIEDNPYAAPEAVIVGERVPVRDGNSPAFEPISALKVALMSVVSFGVYDLYFWWRQWSVVRNHGVDVKVLWRTVFAGFMFFDFNDRQINVMARNGIAVSMWLKAAPGMYLFGLILDRVSDQVFEGQTLILITLATATFRAVSLYATQAGANQVLQAEGYRGPYNRGLSVGAVFVGLLGIFTWAVIFGLALGAFDSIESG